MDLYNNALGRQVGLVSHSVSDVVDMAREFVDYGFADTLPSGRWST